MEALPHAGAVARPAVTDGVCRLPDAGHAAAGVVCGDASAAAKAERRHTASGRADGIGARLRPAATTSLKAWRYRRRKMSGGTRFCLTAAYRWQERS